MFMFFFDDVMDGAWVNKAKANGFRRKEKGPR